MATNLSATFPVEAAREMPLGLVLRAYMLEARTELVQLLRAPGMVIPFLLLPPVFYIFFGVVMAGASAEIQSNPALRNYLYSGWCTYAAMGPGIFGVGCVLAIEREAGLLKLKRALPAPTGSYLAAKMIVSMAFALLAVGGVIAAALVAGQITMTAGQLLGHAAVLTVGAVPFAALGLFIGAYASGSTSPVFANLVFLPMLWLAGLFFPLPKAMEPWVVIWPAFHLNQVALAAGGVGEFKFIDPLMAAAVLAGVTVLFGGLAIRRLARVG